MTTSSPRRRLLRAADGRVLGGVAGGLAEHLGVPLAAVRVGFVVLALAGGAGLLMYAALWVTVPTADRSRGGADAWPGAAVLLGAGFAVLFLLQGVGLSLSDATAWPLAVAFGGAAVVWRQVDQSGRSGVSTARLPRLLAGVALVVAGVAAFLVSRGDLGVLRRSLGATVVVVAGVALLAGPWVVRQTNELRVERRERIRTQERAELAAHVHDSLLHTLTLIQKAADDPREVTRLARSQERELRGWLYQPRAAADGQSLRGAVEAAAAEVELLHGTPVEVVVVGDCSCDDRARALVAATREALLNAARHSGADTVAVYAEVEPQQVTVFVRDRGCGFDPAAVPPDRHGLAGSVTGRMQRHGGQAVVRSSPGEGTEVRLELPRG